MATNVVSSVNTQLAKAIKSGDKSILTPAEWAKRAGFSGSAASPLRKHMARDNGNGCGRQARYPAMSAETLQMVLQEADLYQAEDAQAKRDRHAAKIRTKLRPAAQKGARTAKDTATRKRAAPKASKPAVVAEKVTA